MCLNITANLGIILKLNTASVPTEISVTGISTEYKMLVQRWTGVQEGEAYWWVLDFHKKKDIQSFIWRPCFVFLKSTNLKGFQCPWQLCFWQKTSSWVQAKSTLMLHFPKCVIKAVFPLKLFCSSGCSCFFGGELFHIAFNSSFGSHVGCGSKIIYIWPLESVKKILGPMQVFACWGKLRQILTSLWM